MSCGLHGLSSRLPCGLLLTRQHLHVVHPYLHYRAAHPILVIIRAAMDATLHIELVALVYIFLYCLCQSTPEDEVVPLGALRHLCPIGKAVSTIRSGKRETGHSHITVDITHIGLTAHITDKDNFIYRHNNSF